MYSTFVFYITYYKFTFQTNLGGTVKKKRWVWPRPWCLCQRLYEGEVRRLQYHRRWLLQSALWSQPTEAIKRKRQSWGRYMLVLVNWTFEKSATSFPKRADVSQNSRYNKMANLVLGVRVGTYLEKKVYDAGITVARCVLEALVSILLRRQAEWKWTKPYIFSLQRIWNITVRHHSAFRHWVHVNTEK